jgi:hypothetical protein
VDISGQENFVNDWLQLKKTRGIIDNLYDKWILGKEAAQKSCDGQLGGTCSAGGDEI